MPLRIVMRWVAIGAPYSWFGFATRFKDPDGIIGSKYFQEFSKSVKATFHGQGTDTGLMESLDSLGSERFDPNKVHPLIREFYEHTSRFDMKIDIKWNPIIRPLGALYQWIIAKKMQNLNIPLDTDTLKALDNWIELIDLESDKSIDYRCWIRVQRDSKVPVYVGAYKTFSSTVDNQRCCYISVAFPLPGGNLTTVLSPFNLQDNGLLLTTRDRDSTEAGVYIIFPHKKSFTMIPAFGLAERFQLRVNSDKEEVNVIHDCFWLGLSAFQMQYTITRMQPRQENQLHLFYQRAEQVSNTMQSKVGQKI